MPKPVRGDSDHFHDECGVFGIFNHSEAAKMTYLGLYALQHRGQESAGIVSSDGAQLHIHKSMGHVQEIFTPAVISHLPGASAIVYIICLGDATGVLSARMDVRLWMKVAEGLGVPSSR